MRCLDFPVGGWDSNPTGWECSHRFHHGCARTLETKLQSRGFTTKKRIVCLPFLTACEDKSAIHSSYQTGKTSIICHQTHMQLSSFKSSSSSHDVLIMSQPGDANNLLSDLIDRIRTTESNNPYESK